MRGRVTAAIVVLGTLSACASSDPFDVPQGAFLNSYSSLVIENGPVGPVCDGGVIRDEKCWIDGTGYDLGRGFVRTPDGRIIRLDRNERRWQRERAEAIQGRKDVLASLENGTPLPPNSPALPENQSRPAVPPPPPPAPPPPTSAGFERPD